MSRYIAVCVLLALASAAYAAEAAEAAVEEVETAPIDRNSLSSVKLPGELSIPANYMTILTTGATLIAGVLGVSVLLALILPLFGVKLCYLLGSCDTYAYDAPLNGYNAYSTGGTYNSGAVGYGNNYSKRSLEYVGPILKALSSSYDKYVMPIVNKTSGGKKE